MTMISANRIQSLYNLLRSLCAKNHSGTAEEIRSKKRYQRGVWTTASVMSFRVATLLTGILTVPLTLKYLGTDLFGVWMVLTSIVEFATFYDFGLGVGLRNLLIECDSRKDYFRARKIIVNAMTAICILALLLVLGTLFFAPMLPWETLIKCDSLEARQQILPGVRAVMIAFAISLPATQLLNVTVAYQRGYLGYGCYLIGRLVGFAFIIICVMYKLPFWMLAGGYIAIPNFVLLLGWLIFIIKVPALRPWGYIPSFAMTKQLFSIGIWVVVHQLSFTLTNTGIVILIGNTIGASATVPYSVTQKLLSVLSIFPQAFRTGIYAAMGEAWHSGDKMWMKKSIQKTFWMLLITTWLPAVPIVLFGRFVITHWTRTPDALPSILLLIACGLSIGASVASSIYGGFVLAINDVRFAALVKLVAGLIVVSLGYWLGKHFQSVSAIVFVQFVFGLAIPAVIYRHYILSKIKVGIPQLD
jgi:O-antigen/teichoic acid export membrane protein